MVNHKKSALIDILDEYQRIKEDGKLSLVIFQTKYGEKHGIGNSKACEVLLDAAIEELKRQIEEL